MCGIHIHIRNGMKRSDIEMLLVWGKVPRIRRLAKALQQKYPDSIAVKFIAHTSNKRVKLFDGNGIYRLSQRVRKTCVNSYNGHWSSCLDNDIPPSGRSWDWVKMRVIVILYREWKKNTTSLPSNQGFVYLFVYCFYWSECTDLSLYFTGIV